MCVGARFCRIGLRVSVDCFHNPGSIFDRVVPFTEGGCKQGMDEAVT